MKKYKKIFPIFMTPNDDVNQIYCIYQTSTPAQLDVWSQQSKATMAMGQPPPTPGAWDQSSYASGAKATGQGAPGCCSELTGCWQGILNLRETVIFEHHTNCHSEVMLPIFLPMPSLWNRSFGSCCDKYKNLQKNPCETGNKGGSV